MAVTLCVPPRPGELCAPVRILLRQDSVVMELTARHRITSVEWDEREHAVVMVVEITDPQTARPVDVRIDVIDGDVPQTDTRVRTIGRIVRGGQELEVVGTYLGVVADEN
jgi:stalled ribosome rescue protein Dom34